MSINEIREEPSNHKYRTEIPNVLRKIKLDPFARTLYWYYKSIAGDSGACFQTNATISEETGMSQTTIAKKRKILEQPQEILGGKPLIRVTKRLKENGEADSTLVEIVDIWEENFKIIYGLVSKTRGIVSVTTKEEPLKKTKEKTNKKESGGAYATAETFDLPIASQSGTASPLSIFSDLDLTDTIKGNLLKAYDNDTIMKAVEAVKSFESRKDDTSNLMHQLKRLKKVEAKRTPSETEAKSIIWLQNVPKIGDDAIEKLASSYTLENIRNTVALFFITKDVSNPRAWFTTALKQEWWKDNESKVIGKLVSDRLFKVLRRLQDEIGFSGHICYEDGLIAVYGKLGALLFDPERFSDTEYLKKAIKSINKSFDIGKTLVYSKTLDKAQPRIEAV